VIVLDVSILAAAHLRDHPHHPAAHRWLMRALSRGRAVVVPDAVWVGFLRVVTSTRIFSVPSTLAVATAFVRAVATAPGYRTLSGHVDGIETFIALCIESDATGDLVPDAYIASIARAYGCPVASFDRDFRRFDDLDIVVPE